MAHFALCPRSDVSGAVPNLDKAMTTQTKQIPRSDSPLTLQQQENLGTKLVGESGFQPLVAWFHSCIHPRHSLRILLDLYKSRLELPRSPCLRPSSKSSTHSGTDTGRHLKGANAVAKFQSSYRPTSRSPTWSEKPQQKTLPRPCSSRRFQFQTLDRRHMAKRLPKLHLTTTKFLRSSTLQPLKVSKTSLRRLLQIAKGATNAKYVQRTSSTI